MTKRTFRQRRMAADIGQLEVARLLGITRAGVIMFERRGGRREETVARYDMALRLLIRQRDEARQRRESR